MGPLMSSTYPKPYWVPDERVTSCKSCKVEFSLFIRKHHCRACGYIFCSTCSSHTANLKLFGYTEQQRVCNECFSTKRYLNPNSTIEYKKDPISTSTSIPKPAIRAGEELAGVVTEVVVRKMVDSFFD